MTMERSETTTDGRNGGRAIFRGVLCFLVLNAVARLPFCGPAVQAVTLLISPLLAGLLAGQQGKRPRLQGVLACALAASLLLAGEAYAAREFPRAGRDLVPFAFVLVYATALGAVGAWISARDRRDEEPEPK
jgi:hypothetical protein